MITEAEERALEGLGPLVEEVGAEAAFNFLRARELHNALVVELEALRRKVEGGGGLPLTTALSTIFPLGGGGNLIDGLTLTYSQGKTSSGGLLDERGGIVTHFFGPAPYQVPTAAASGRSWIILNPLTVTLTITDQAGGSIVIWGGVTGASAVLSNGLYRAIIIEKVSGAIRVSALTTEGYVNGPYNPSLTDLVGVGLTVTGSGRSRTLTVGAQWELMADTGTTTARAGSRIYVASTAAGNTVGMTPTAFLVVDLANDGEECELLIDAGACVVTTAGGVGQSWYKVSSSGGGDIPGPIIGLALGQLLMKVIRIGNRQRFTLTVYDT